MTHHTAHGWRLTAPIRSWFTVADYCWRRGERIMRLSRRFAAPIADSAVIGTLAQPKKERAVEQISRCLSRGSAFR